MRPPCGIRPLVTAACLAALLSGCGGSNKKMTEPPSEMPGDGMDMADLGTWNSVSAAGAIVGFENTTLDLRVAYDPSTGVGSITTSSGGLPAVSGTWRGGYAVNYTGTTTPDETGDAEVAVSIQDSTVTATVTYKQLAVAGGGDVTSSPATVGTDGRFSPGGSVTITGFGVVDFSGEGQFGGTDQRGVAGYIDAIGNFRSVFHGTRGDDDSN